MGMPAFQGKAFLSYHSSEKPEWQVHRLIWAGPQSLPSDLAAHGV